MESDRSNQVKDDSSSLAIQSENASRYVEGTNKSIEGSKNLLQSKDDRKVIETMLTSAETLRKNPEIANVVNSEDPLIFQSPGVKFKTHCTSKTAVVSIFKQPSKASSSKKLKNKKIRFKDLEGVDETTKLLEKDPGDNTVVAISKQDTSTYKASRFKKIKNKRIRFKALEADDETSKILGKDPDEDPVPSNSGTSSASVDSALDTTRTLEDELNELNKEAEYARAAAKSCRSMLEVLYDSLEIIQRETDDYLENVRTDPRPDLTRNPYYRVAVKLSGYIQVLRNKVEKVETAARNANNAADVAEEKAFFVGEVVPGGRPSLVLQNAVADGKGNYIIRAHSGADAYIIVNRALNILKKTMNEVKETKHPKELSDKSLHEYERDCVNRTWRTRAVHGIIFLAGIVILSCLVPLLKVRSDHFYAVTSIGILALVWSIGYWGYELYTLIQSCKTEISPSVSTNVSLRIDTISRIDRMRLYERMYFIRDQLRSLKTLALDSASDSQDSDEWHSDKKDSLTRSNDMDLSNLERNISFGDC